MRTKTVRQPKKNGVARVPVVMQLEALECGAACLAMVLAYYGKWLPLEQVRVDCGVSGGQRQRLLIARAIAPKPKILLFDEATSALDKKTQKQVSDALDALHCTRIVIAHRLSTVKHCDRILVLDGGRIIEDGTYDELMEEGGFFAELVERQRIDHE